MNASTCAVPSGDGKRLRVRRAARKDLAWLAQKDRHVNPDWVRRCVRHGEYLVCECESSHVGFLRYNLFWGVVPYMDMIFVLEDHRRNGVGTALFGLWQDEMRASGAKVLMTSCTLGEEEPREWHRRNGFEESGQVAFGRLDVPPEVFLLKNL